MQSNNRVNLLRSSLTLVVRRLRRPLADIREAMERTIIESLDRIEDEQRVCVLYAVESGSRAWGFASADSDWDVRFIYLHHPDWHLFVQKRRDVLEFHYRTLFLMGGSWVPLRT